MNRAYIYEGDFSKGAAGYELVKRAAKLWLQEANLSDKELTLDCRSIDESTIKKDKKGKPYFENLDIEFSISHSDNLWIGLFGKSQCGIDIQYVKPAKYESIAEKLFTKEEQHFVRLWGQDGFFRLWTVKEALGKALGIGIFRELPCVISDNMDILTKISTNQGDFHVKEIEIDDYIKCAYAIKKCENGFFEQAELRLL